MVYTKHFEGMYPLVCGIEMGCLVYGGLVCIHALLRAPQAPGAELMRHGARVLLYGVLAASMGSLWVSQIGRRDVFRNFVVRHTLRALP